MNNAELIQALRYCAEHEGCDYYIAKDCPIESTWMCGVDCGQILMHDAADALEAAEKRIAELEAQLPKEGKWIPINWTYDSILKCSNCGELACCCGDYCPNCGAKMKGANDEADC